MTDSPREGTPKAPDGGWGWFVCLGRSLITLSLRSLEPSFGLLFRDILEDLQVDSTGISVISSILDVIVNFSGVFVGPLLKRYSYRRVALFGSLLCCAGLILTSRANSMLYIICTYSVLGGLGSGLALAASFVAINTFFDKRRGQAVGFAMAGTSMAMMLVPQLIFLLLQSYGFRGTMLILGGCSLHSLVGACLLRPLESRPKIPLLKDNEQSSKKSDGFQSEKNGETASPLLDEKKPKRRTWLKKVKDAFDLDLLQDAVYINVIAGLSLYYVAESNFKLMVPFFLSSIGMTNGEIAFCLSVTAFTDILARLILPTIFDRLGVTKRSVFWICCPMIAIGRSTLAVQTKGTSLIVTFAVIGFLRGATMVNLNLTVSECCSLKKLPSAFGIFMVAKGISAITMSPLIGYVRDVSQSYSICIHIMAVMIIVTFVTWSVEFLYGALREKKETSSNSNEASPTPGKTCGELRVAPIVSWRKVPWRQASVIDRMARGETDGGWAWAIVAGVTIINVATLPVQQCFGLIFAERFGLLGISATQTSLILHLNGTITCSLGLISGPMMKMFSFRKIAFLGGLTVAIGICATAFAVSLPSIILTYCLIVGIGQGIIYPATSLALNTYFRKKRSLAMGFSVTLTGLGPILMPLLIVKLLENYATLGTLLILAGIATHSFIGASLLKPFDESKETRCLDETKEDVKNERTSESENEAKDDAVQRRLLHEHRSESENEERGRPKSEISLTRDEEKFRAVKKKRLSQRIAEHWDLDLLKDRRYLALVLGLSISLVAETNFNALIPFVLDELSGLDRNAIASVMSIQAALDITARLCVPLVAQKASWTSKNLYALSLLGFTLGRIILSTWGSSYGVVICVSVIVGVSKGTKAVFQALIIPDYVPLDRLPAACGIQMVCNGILSISLGPIIGVVHDAGKSYIGALHFTSFLSLSCIFMWLIGGIWSAKIFKDSSKECETESSAEVC
ncbi:hypothetical protein KM043_008981 [Ampulex compressa]|nr:hypothetical protein KM043_008981 [Ampulex compressa]